MNIRRPVLASTITTGELGPVTIERTNGGQIFTVGHLGELLEEAGFQMTPQGLRLRPDSACS